MLMRGSPIQGVLKMAWLVPAWRGLPKYSSQTFFRSANRTLVGSRRICSSVFAVVAMAKWYQ